MRWEKWKEVDESLNILGGMHKRELHWLAWRAKDCNLVIEIGTWLGRSTYAMGATVKGKVITIDTFDPVIPTDRSSLVWFRNRMGVPIETFEENRDYMLIQCLKNLEELIKGGKIEIIKGDSNSVVKGLQGLKGSVDMVFIDGDHRYEAVKKDILNYKPLIRKGGLISGHDFANSNSTPQKMEVRKAVLELLPESKNPRGSIWEYWC